MASATLERQERFLLWRMNSEEFARLPDSEDYRFELLDGRVVMSARPNTEHQNFVFELGVVLRSWVRKHKLGKVYLDTQLHLDKYWSPVPDLLFLETANLDRITRKWIVGTADLAVEVLSPNDEEADRVTKLEAYARFGIPWYWIVDLQQHQLEEHKRVRGRYGPPAIIPFAETFYPRLFKGLAVDLADLAEG